MGAGTHRGWWLLLLAALVAYPWLFGHYQIDLMSLSLVYGLFAVSLDLQWGFTGILNLAPAASFGLGAYAYVLTLRHHPAAVGPALALAVVCPAAFGVIVGFPSFRARATQVYFALITLAAGATLEKVATVWYGFTGGSNGLVGVAYPRFAGGSPMVYFYFCGVLVALGLAVSIWLARSAAGSVWIAVRENEVRAAALGYRTESHKLLAFASSSALAGLAGALVTPLVGMAHPSLLDILLSLKAFVWVAIGGQGTIWGPFVAAGVITLAEAWLSGVSASLYLLVLGVLFTLSVILVPGGLASLVARRAARSLPSAALDEEQGV